MFSSRIDPRSVRCVSVFLALFLSKSCSGLLENEHSPVSKDVATQSSKVYFPEEPNLDRNEADNLLNVLGYKTVTFIEPEVKEKKQINNPDAVSDEDTITTKEEEHRSPLRKRVSRQTYQGSPHLYPQLPTHPSYPPAYNPSHPQTPNYNNQFYSNYNPSQRPSPSYNHSSYPGYPSFDPNKRPQYPNYNPSNTQNSYNNSQFHANYNPSQRPPYYNNSHHGYTTFNPNKTPFNPSLNPGDNSHHNYPYPSQRPPYQNPPQYNNSSNYPYPNTGQRQPWLNPSFNNSYPSNPQYHPNQSNNNSYPHYPPYNPNKQPQVPSNNPSPRPPWVLDQNTGFYRNNSHPVSPFSNSNQGTYSNNSYSNFSNTRPGAYNPSFNFSNPASPYNNPSQRPPSNNPMYNYSNSNINNPYYPNQNPMGGSQYGQNNGVNNNFNNNQYNPLENTLFNGQNVSHGQTPGAPFNPYTSNLAPFPSQGQQYNPNLKNGTSLDPSRVPPEYFSYPH